VEKLSNGFFAGAMLGLLGGVILGGVTVVAALVTIIG
jgi:hypothetical protein